MKQSTEKRIEKQVNSKKNRAEKILGDASRCAKFIDKVQSKDLNRKLRKLEEYIRSMISMVKSYITGEYTNVPIASLVVIMAALIYWIAPVDVIPDFIPFFGYMDDATAISACLAAVKLNLDQYIEWESARATAA